jgi:hypothetical protein
MPFLFCFFKKLHTPCVYMHDSALKSGELFAEMYGGINKIKIVLDIGGKNVNGSFLKKMGMKYICVDIVVKPTILYI